MGRPFDLTTRDMGSEFRYGLGNLKIGSWSCKCERKGKSKESPPNFCNGLGTIYIVSSRGRTF